MPKKPEKELQRAVFREFGISTKKPLREATNPMIQGLIGQKKGKHHLDGRQDLSRLPCEFIRGWVDMDGLQNILLRKTRIRNLVEKLGKTALEQSIETALKWRAIKSYEEEWSGLNSEHIRDIIIPRTFGLPVKANELNSKKISDLLNKRSNQDKIVLLDIGSGAGGTIIPIIKELAPEDRKKVNVVLLDVMKSGFDVAKKELMENGLKRSQIKTLHTNFFDIAALLGEVTPLEKRFRILEALKKNVLRNRLEDIKGKVDLVTSGAALHHTSDLEPIFRSISRLLKKGGEIHFWDWTTHATHSPEIDLSSPEFKEEVKVTEGKGPKVIDTIKSVFHNWLDLLGMDKEAEETLKRDLEKPEKFNFEEWLRKNSDFLRDPPSGKGCQYIEGQRLPEYYKKAIENSGMKVTKIKFPFIGEGHRGNLLFFLHAVKP